VLGRERFGANSTKLRRTIHIRKDLSQIENYKKMLYFDAEVLCSDLSVYLLLVFVMLIMKVF